MDQNDLKQIEEIFARGLDKFAATVSKGFDDTVTKGDLAPIKTSLDDIRGTLTRTTALTANLVEDMKDIKSDMTVMKASLESHTISLDELLKNTKNWQTETTAVISAIKRHEDWIAKIAAHLGLDLEKT